MLKSFLPFGNERMHWHTAMRFSSLQVAHDQAGSAMHHASMAF